MRKLIGLLAATALVAAAAAPAGAAVLTATGDSLGVAIGALPPITIAGGTANIDVSSGAGDFVIPGNLFGPTTVVLPTQLFTGVSLISSLNVTNVGNATMAITGGSSNVGLNGVAIVGVLGGLVNLNIPLSPVGAGGVVQGGAASLMITVTGHNWTTGLVGITGVTSQTTGGLFLNTVTASGSDNRTIGHKGSILLISPFRAVTNAAGILTGFGTQLLTFVPEPGTLLLIGTGVAGIALIGRKKLQ